MAQVQTEHHGVIETEELVSVDYNCLHCHAINTLKYNKDYGSWWGKQCDICNHITELNPLRKVRRFPSPHAAHIEFSTLHEPVGEAALKGETMMQQIAKDMVAEADNALSQQVGGSHYKNLVIQPVEYIHRNKIGFCEGSAIKYLSRWRDKGGVEDLKKAKHFIDLLIEMETKK
jgi:hypothetical protein